MIELLEKHRDKIALLCGAQGVKRLEVFGSAASGDFDPAKSDIDFFFEFDANPDSLSERYFRLMEGLESLLGCPIDLVSSRDAKNPFFLRVANRHRVTLYAA